ncbi:MAG: recombinase family protein, partial [Actinomycetota bacterium]|nr:recombinase family protein [Actinomycetota bacterium]
MASSTLDQNLDAQHQALAAAGCERIFLDTASGKLASRAQLEDALMVARPGDELVVIRLDRLGRWLKHLIDLAGDLQARKV